jgi:porin
MRLAQAGGLALGVVLLASGAARGEQPVDWRHRRHLTDDWAGYRSRLESRGISPLAGYTTGLWANLHGGIETGTRYEGFATWGVAVDLGRLASWKGATFFIDWNAYHGGRPSSELIGQFSSDNVTGWEAEPSVRFYDIHLAQRLFDDRLLLKMGQITIGDDFGAATYANLFCNAVFGDIISVTADSEVPVHPLAAPGGVVRWHPTARWFAAFGAYADDAGEDESSNFGFDWKLSGDAALATEVGTYRKLGSLSGTYTLGAYADSGSQPDFRSGGEANGAFAVYGMVNQMLLRDAAGNDKLGAFVRALAAPLQDRSVIEWHLDAGLDVFGVFRRRLPDAFGVGLSHTAFGDDYVSAERRAGNDVSRDETVVEVTYRLPITGWLALHPSLQIFLDPHESRRDAVVFGQRAVVTF